MGTYERTRRRDISRYHDRGLGGLLDKHLRPLGNIRSGRQNPSPVFFNKAVELIEKVDRVLVLGCMAYASLATHMGRMRCKIMAELVVVDSDGVLEATQFLRSTPKFFTENEGF